MTDVFQTDTNRNFPEDYDQENGNYINTCKDCNLPFRGNKHRIWCKMCEEPNWDELSKIQRPDGPTVIPGAWIQGEMVGYSRCMVKRVRPLLEQLSSKEQECEKYKKLYDAYATGPVINPLYADNGELCGYSLISRDTGETLCSEEDAETIQSLRAENERLKTTLVAGAELIKENWSKLCDDEGYGPQNLLLRMDGTLNTSGYPGYSSGEFEKLRKRCEDLEAENQQLKLKVVEDAVRFSMYMSGKSTIGDQDYFRRSFEAGYYKTWKIDN